MKPSFFRIRIWNLCWQFGHILRFLTSSILFVAQRLIVAQYTPHDFENQLDSGVSCGTVVLRAMDEVPQITSLPPIPPLQAVVSPLKDFGSSKEERQPEPQHWANATRKADRRAITPADINKAMKAIRVIESKHVRPGEMIFLPPNACLRLVASAPRTGAKITGLGEHT